MELIKTEPSKINAAPKKEAAPFFAFGQNHSTASSFFQPKLTINQPNDPYEQEADAMAEKVMRMKEPAKTESFFKPAVIPLQRKCEACEEEEKIQRKIFTQTIQRQHNPGEDVPVREGEPGDIVEAVTSVPLVSNFLTSIGDDFLLHLGHTWDRSLLGKFSLIGGGLGIAGGLGLAVYAARNNPAALDIMLSPLSGTVIPAFDFDIFPNVLRSFALEVNFDRYDEHSTVRNIMGGVHFDVGRLLPPSLGFGPVNEWTPIGAPWDSSTGTIPRKCSNCDEEKQLQQKTDELGMPVPPATESYIQSLDGSGQPLNKKEKAFFEPRFGYDFGDVKIHTGAAAAASAKSINALAYTTGSNIVFGEGQYAPGNDSGKRLLGHELTHVVQQGGSESVAKSTLQLAPTIEIVDNNFIGPLQQNQRRADASCPIHCNGSNVGSLHAMGLFYHQSRTGVRNTPNATDNGVGTALHFMAQNNRLGCSCDDYQIVQIITTTHPASGRNGTGYIDNGGQNTPFYGDVYSGGSGEHTISVAGGFRDQGETVSTTRSLYDIPYRDTSGINTTIEWQAEACVVCVKNSGPDVVLGGVGYGFRLPYNSTTGSFDTIEGIGPNCLGYASSNFIRVLGSDPTISGYDFTTEYGPGDFPVPATDARYA